MGRGHTVHWEQLRLRRTHNDTYNMTLPQQKIFDDDMASREDVDRALRQIDDWPLTAEVQFYRTSCRFLDEEHEQLHKLRISISQHMSDAKEAVRRLSQHHAYSRVQDILQRENDGALWLANSELRAQMQQAQHAPDSSIPQSCVWCQKTNHRPQDCIIFTQCMCCESYGHLTEDCRRPHRRCVDTCRVPCDHPRYGRRCKSHPYVEDLEFAQEMAKESRIDRLSRRLARQQGC